MRSVAGLVRKVGTTEGVAGCRVEAEFEYRVSPGESVVAAPRKNVRATADAPKSYRTTGRSVATAGRDGGFAVALPFADDLTSDVRFVVSAPSGAVIGESVVPAEDLGDTVVLEVEAPEPIVVEVIGGDAADRKRVTGRVFDVEGRRIPAGLQVAVYETDGGDGRGRPLVLAWTDGAGYFAGDLFADGPLKGAAATVGKFGAAPIPLLKGRLPEPLLLAVDLEDGGGDGEDKDCECGTAVVPRTPDQADIASSPSTFSTDLGTGCVQFNVPNRAIEEFDFYTVVRTTEPAIRGVTLGGGAPPQKKRATALWLNRFRLMRGRARDGAGVSEATFLRLIEEFLEHFGQAKVTDLFGAEKGDWNVEDLDRIIELLELLDLQEEVAQAGRSPGRVEMDGLQLVDWDATPTFYEAVTIAHGHLLHFKQTWYADGYSLGDLLYSLPLAPGQKRMVSIVDWERREQASRSESQMVSESLSALLSRDRDLNEVVGGALRESMRGGSSASTWGIGAGMGGAVSGSYEMINFGALHGVSGGYGQGDSQAWQDSSRDVAASSLQTLRDNTLQSAASVRGLRATAVYTATQGEAVRASTEVVANHNHCHALTIQYFEVLRHLKLMHELADVQECLFVPLPMESFDRAKALRWREATQPYLRRPELSPGFDAARRVDTNWAAVDTPVGRYGDETITSISGELEVTVLVPLPPMPEAPKPTPGQTAAEAAAAVGAALNPTTGLLGGLLAVATGGISLIAGAATDAVSQGAHAVAESLVLEPTAEERYNRFHREVMPGVAVGFVDGLELYALVGASEVRLNGADFTLASDYRPGAPLLVSVRGTVTTPLKRSDVTQLIVKSPSGLPPGCRVILNTATLRYRTASFEHHLVSDWRVNDDIELPTVTVSVTPTSVTVTQGPPARGASLYTPLDTWEQRNPRKEDVRLTAELIAHLNDNLEYFHKAIWWNMDPNRRYMLLDGFKAPNSGGRSVASVVENQLIGIAGNSLVMPVARGVRLDPRFTPQNGETIDLKGHYAPTTEIAPTRISLPTRGVFAEAVMGSCNACEEIDDTRFWRWEDAPIDDVPAPIAPTTESRRVDLSGGTTPTALPQPVVAFQNSPQAPDPTGLGQVIELLGKEAFRDITGLAANQQNAAAAYKQALETAAEFGKEASKLAQQAAMVKSLDKSMASIDKAESGDKISKDKAKQLRTTALEKAIGGTDGALSAEDVAERMKAIQAAVTDGAIDADAGRNLSENVLRQYVAGDDRAADERVAAARLIDELPRDGVTRVETGDGATTVESGSGEGGGGILGELLRDLLAQVPAPGAPPDAETVAVFELGSSADSRLFVEAMGARGAKNATPPAQSTFRGFPTPADQWAAFPSHRPPEWWLNRFARQTPTWVYLSGHMLASTFSNGGFGTDFYSLLFSPLSVEQNDLVRLRAELGDAYGLGRRCKVVVVAGCAAIGVPASTPEGPGIQQVFSGPGEVPTVLGFRRMSPEGPYTRDLIRLFVAELGKHWDARTDEDTLAAAWLAAGKAWTVPELRNRGIAYLSRDGKAYEVNVASGNKWSWQEMV